MGVNRARAPVDPPGRRSLGFVLVSSEGGGVLDVLDAGSDRGRVYRTLVGRPGADAAELAAHTGLDRAGVAAALAELVEAGAVAAVADDVWEAHSPAEVTERLLRRDAERRAGLRRAGAELEQLFRFARRESGHYAALEVVEDPARILAVLRRLQETARAQVRVIDRPPYFAPAEYYAEQERVQRERMARGVAYRVIYYESAFDDPVAGPNMARMIAEGEQARTLEEPPIKLAVGDDDLAVLTLGSEGRSGVVSLVVRPSGLLTGLVAVFETLWRLAVPASVADGHPIDDRDRQILTLMASGATDDAIARRLALSRRTVVRRTTALLATLGATNRFQAGVQAARRGWL